MFNIEPIFESGRYLDGDKQNEIGIYNLHIFVIYLINGTLKLLIVKNKIDGLNKNNDGIRIKTRYRSEEITRNFAKLNKLEIKGDEKIKNIKQDIEKLIKRKQLGGKDIAENIYESIIKYGLNNFKLKGEGLKNKVMFFKYSSFFIDGNKTLFSMELYKGNGELFKKK